MQLSFDAADRLVELVEARRGPVPVEDAARTFRLALADFIWLKLLALDSEHHAAVLRKLERLRGHKLTYVDASSLVFLGQLRIGDVWSVDQDLAIEGARVMPRPA